MIKPILAAAGLSLLAACSTGEARGEAPPPAAAPTGTPFTVVEEEAPGYTEARGVARAVLQATLSTRLMGSVLEVPVKEGDRVARGAVLVRIDAADLAARRQQVAAGVAQAQASLEEAATHARRMRALFAEEAAPRAQVDAAEAALARAEAGVRAARAGGAELAATEGYSTLRAPFAGTVVQRLADPGAFAAPGAPLVVIQDASRLRVAVSAPPEAVHGLSRGQPVSVRIEGRPAEAVVEGVVPSPAGQLYTVNALVDNPAGRFLPGSSATLRIPGGVRRAVRIPASALVREGDLTGVLLRSGERRWVRVGRAEDGRVEVLSGLRAGETILLPAGG